MKTKLLSFVSVIVLAVATGTASAAPVELTSAQLDNVTAGASASSIAGGGAIGLVAYSSSGTYASAGGWSGGASSAGHNTSFALYGAVVSFSSSTASTGYSRH